MKLENINLFEEMEKIVDRVVVCYKDDLIHDKKALLDPKEIKEGNKFYWYVRDSGTDLIRENQVFVKNSWNYNKATYYLDICKEIYEVEVKKLGRKYVYGDIKKVAKKDMENLLKTKSIVMEYDNHNRIQVNEIFGVKKVLWQYVTDNNEIKTFEGTKYDMQVEFYRLYKSKRRCESLRAMKIIEGQIGA